jgi:hypothetical protein
MQRRGGGGMVAPAFFADFFVVFFEDFLVALFLVEPRLVAMSFSLLGAKALEAGAPVRGEAPPSGRLNMYVPV